MHPALPPRRVAAPDPCSGAQRRQSARERPWRPAAAGDVAKLHARRGQSGTVRMLSRRYWEMLWFCMVSVAGRQSAHCARVGAPRGLCFKQALLGQANASGRRTVPRYRLLAGAAPSSVTGFPSSRRRLTTHVEFAQPQLLWRSANGAHLAAGSMGQPRVLQFISRVIIGAAEIATQQVVTGVALFLHDAQHRRMGTPTKASAWLASMSEPSRFQVPPRQRLRAATPPGAGRPGCAQSRAPGACWRVRPRTRNAGGGVEVGDHHRAGTPGRLPPTPAVAPASP